MSDNLNNKKVVLFGPGKMGFDYFKVLKELNVDLKNVVGKSKSSNELFHDRTSFKPIMGCFEGWLEKGDKDVDYAVVAVSEEALSETAINLMNSGIKKILLEKPAGLNVEEIRKVNKRAEETGTTIVVGYNRRMYSSVLKGQKIIEEDGGVLSFNFEFTEWREHLEAVNDIARKHWFLINSCHVLDMAFFLGGVPEEFASYTNGGCKLHPNAGVYSGAGRTVNGALFSYQANWLSPGRWGAEFMTANHRLIYRPLEKLQIQKHGSVAIDYIDIDDEIDQKFKPGLFLEVKHFLEDSLHPNMITISEHFNNVESYYNKILFPVV